MKNINNLIFLIPLFLISCGKDDGVDPNQINRIELSGLNEVKEYLSINLNATVVLASGKQGSNSTITWSTNDNSIAQVNNGQVTGISAGTATISASSKGVSADITITVLANPVRDIDLSSIPNKTVISHQTDLLVTINFESGDHVTSSELIPWNVTSNQELAVINEGRLLAIDDGIINISGSLGKISVNKEIEISAYEINEIDPFLATPAEEHLYEVPVVIIRFLPTADGVNIDVRKDTDFYELGEISLANMIGKIDAFDKRIKFSLEEGSKFRGYKNDSATPSLGYKVVKYITFYESTPASSIPGVSDGIQVYLPDYFSIFEEVEMEDLVNNHGVKEVWIWSGNRALPTFPSYDPTLHDGITPVGGFESNMSSPTTEDISNSYRNTNDLPVYDHTYIVYTQNTRRTQAEAIHNHGHQLEAMLSYIDYGLFWEKFVGTVDGNPPIGRCGDTHHPPNTTMGYDYLNMNLVNSDIEDWKPDGTGEKKMVNADAWGNLRFDWPGQLNFNQRIESQWYIYWMQNMPGHENGIPYYSTGTNMTDWWQFTADWDKAINENLGLH